MAPAPAPPHVAVIGGGISGLAAAVELRRRLGARARITVFEKNAVIGGHVRVSDVAGFPMDAGAESLLARRPEAVDLAASVGLESDIVSPARVGAGIVSRGHLHPMPTGTVMGVPTDLEAAHGLLTIDEIAAAQTHQRPAPPFALPLTGDVAIGEFVTAHLGRAVVDRLVEPLLGGVYAGHADRLSLDATVPALGAAARQTTHLSDALRDVQAATSGSGTAHSRQSPFAGITGGVGRLAEATAAAAGAELRTGATVRRIERAGARWRVTTGPTVAEETTVVDGIILAVPPPAAARLLRGIAPVAAAELGAVEMASMAIIAMAVPRRGFPAEAAPSSSGFLVPPVEGRTIKAVTYSSVKWPWLGELTGDLVALRASVGRSGEVADLQRDDADLIAAVRSDLADLAGITGRPVDTRVTRWGGALPQYAVGHVDRVERIRADVARLPGMAVCGAVYDGVGIAACVATAARAVDDLVADLTAPVGDGHVRIES